MRVDFVEVALKEWDEAGPDKIPGLACNCLAEDPRLRASANALRSKIRITEGYDGLNIKSSSFVGRLNLGPLRISINPKLSGLPLAKLLRYAYGLRDLNSFDETITPTSSHGLHDLLISLLAAEVEELIHSGLVRRYTPISSSMESPRGRILMNEFVRQGGLTQASLSCLHFERSADWHLNQVLVAGLGLAALMTEDAGLRRRIQKILGLIGDVEPLRKLRLTDVERAQRALTRLTAASSGALTLIHLLLGNQGMDFDPSEAVSPVRGFLFDMNLFFQRLVSRFLHDNLEGARIADEYTIRALYSYADGANPQRRRAPAPRPDIALYCEKLLTGFLDAKYRDLWQKSLPREWLYQMSAYALASPNSVSVLLYASMSTEGRDECVEIHHPMVSAAQPLGSVIFRPVLLTYMAELLAPGADLQNARHRLAADMTKMAVLPLNASVFHKN